jgi:hypothetical protein
MWKCPTCGEEIDDRFVALTKLAHKRASNEMGMKFSEIKIGGRFRFFGLVYTKKALSLAEGPEEKRTGHVFLDETEVEQERTDPSPCVEP